VTPRTSRTAAVIVALGLALGTFALYAPVRDFAFLNLDDDQYVTQNPHVRAGVTTDGVRWALASRHAATWHPVTTLSHMLDVELFGLRAGPHHLVSAGLHAVAAALLLVALRALTGALWPSALAAALFAVHPLRVESVAWVSERKDVLSGVFLALSLLAYAGYARRPSVARWLVVALAFGLGLLAKPTLVTLPFVLLLLDAWPLDRVVWPGGDATHDARRPAASAIAFPRVSIARAVAEKLPLVALSGAVSAVTWIAQERAGAMAPGAATSLATRAGGAVVVYATCLARAFSPVRLAVFYPYEPPSAGSVGLAAIVLAAVTTIAIRARREYPYLLVGWLWYLGMLVPVAGFVPVGEQALADRYGYLPLTGIFVALAWGAADAVRARPALRAPVAAVAVAALAILSALTWRQLPVWRDDEALFTHAIEATGGSYLAHTNLGVARLAAGKAESAGSEFAAALKLRPDFAPAHLNLGLALVRLGDPNGALGEFLLAIDLDPHAAAARYQAALLMAARDEHDFAIDQLRAALADRPDDAFAHQALAQSLRARHRTAEAIAEARAAVDLAPDFAAAHNELAIALEDEGRSGEAIEHYREVVRLLPDDPRVHINLASALVAAGRRDEAAPVIDRIRIRWGDSPEVQARLARLAS